MRRRIAVIGSIAIHVACGLALVAVRSTDERDSPPHVGRELVESAEVIELVELVVDERGGGGGTAGSSTSPPANTASTSSARPWVARAEPRRREIVPAPPAERSLGDSLAQLAIGSEDRFLDGESATGRGGDGGGRGAGHGRGGLSLGDQANAGELPPRPPPAPKASKARPAKLVYPTREREASEGELYLARVTVDTDGYVVGARLLRGAGSPKDGDASSMIFRFRYLPALDDDGRPIRSTLEQPFLVQ